MQTSILIVSKNRKSELEYTLNILAQIIDFSENEVLVFLDGCIDNSTVLKDKFSWVRWYSSEKSIGASSARHELYPKALGQLLIGLDDDAHPLTSDFIYQTKKTFDKYSNLGILAFQEIKGIYNSDKEALSENIIDDEEFFCGEFIGCGFAIRKDVYHATDGFPVWIDIYGEESCLSIEVLAQGYDLIYNSKIKINHRVDKEARKQAGMNYFRFGKQLKNATYYYLVYYPFPIIRILKLYWHNFTKYALMDVRCFKIFFETLLVLLVDIPKVLSYRNPVKKDVIKKMRKLSSIKY